jgi:ring-1,2-phenylacetyl-CoA epoxidase subunit PaaC
MSPHDTMSGVPQGMPEPVVDGRLRVLLGHADDNMVLAQRLGEWISRAPELEEDIALGNIALDHLGVARAVYSHVGALEGMGRTEDDLAMGRSEREFLNLLLVEQPNGDFAHTMIRSLFFDVYQTLLWEGMADTEDQAMVGISGRALKEAHYHLRHSSGWVRRLGDGTPESHSRTQTAVDALWRYTAEMFEGDLGSRQAEWELTVRSILDDARLTLPDDPYQRSGGRRGFHSEHLGYLLAEMQSMHRTHPGLEW